jgi:hypothetical protein
MTMFTRHTIESAPPASRRAMAAVTGKQGYLPVAVALLAESPEALEGFLRMSATFDACTLGPVAREVVIMTVALRVLDTAGEVGDQSLAGFLGHGFTRRNALEIVLGVGAYTLSTLANRLTGAPVDEELRAFA